MTPAAPVGAQKKPNLPRTFSVAVLAPGAPACGHVPIRDNPSNLDPAGSGGLVCLR